MQLCVSHILALFRMCTGRSCPWWCVRIMFISADGEGDSWIMMAKTIKWRYSFLLAVCIFDCIWWLGCLCICICIWWPAASGSMNNTGTGSTWDCNLFFRYLGTCSWVKDSLYQFLRLLGHQPAILHHMSIHYSLVLRRFLKTKILSSFESMFLSKQNFP